MSRQLAVAVAYLLAILIPLGAYGQNDTSLIEEVENAQTLSELREYVDNDSWEVKNALLLKLDEFEAQQDEAEKADILFTLYQREDTEENASIQHVGGQPPRHLEFQIKVLDRMAHFPLSENKDYVVDIVESYLADVEAMSTHAWLVSPKQALQIAISRLLIAYSEDETMLSLASRFAESDVIKEYAKGQVIGAVLRHRMNIVQPADDPDYVQRVGIILDMAVRPTLRDMLCSSDRLESCANALEGLLGHDMAKLEAIMSDEERLTAQHLYMLHFFVAVHSLRQMQNGSEMTPVEERMLERTIEYWSIVYPTSVATRKYTGAPLTKVLSEIARTTSDERLRGRIERLRDKS